MRIYQGRYLILVLIFLSGCGQTAVAPPPKTTVAATEISTTPSEIELSDARVVLEEPDIVAFNVKYRFTKGQPSRFYSCEITFPGTDNVGVRLMESWELKSEGVIRDKVMLSKLGVKSYEIRMSESSSPMATYKVISNVLSGPVE